MAGCRKFLCLFAQENVDFRLQELQSLTSLADCEAKYDREQYSSKSPFLLIELPSGNHARKILSRSLLIRSMYELWAAASNYQDLQKAVEELPRETVEQYLRTDYSFKIVIKGFNKSLTLGYQKEVLKKLEFLPFGGHVSLSAPDHEFHLLEDYGENPNLALDTPFRIFLGRLVGNGQRQLIHQYSLKTRRFIGNTSMEAQLAFLMANQAQVKAGDLVCDPFAGTGSVLVSCAHFGGFVIGTDIDCTLLHGRGRPSRANTQQKWRGRDESVLANLEQYGLESRYLDVLVADFAQCVWRGPGELFDAIVTDPPYGVREGARKIVSRSGTSSHTACSYSLSATPNSPPETTVYKLSDIFSDLLEFAAEFLVTGGRLVYWVPVIQDKSAEAGLPSHPCLSLVASSEQPLFSGVARKLITMEKNGCWEPDLHMNPASSGRVGKIYDRFRASYFTKHKH